jgi:hypothetical protein
MKELYVNNIYREIKGLDKKRLNSISAPKTVKWDRYRKLMRYELMAMGCFKLANCYR